MNKKIVFVNQSTGYITIDIINEFVNEYDEIAVLSNGVREQDIPLDPKVKFTKVVRKSRKSNFRKGFKWLLATIQIYILLITKYRNHEVFYFSLPPFSYFCSLFLSRKFSVMIFDVYPDVLKSYNVKESSFLYKTWAMVNRMVFRKAHRIYTIGEGLAERIEQYVDSEKISIVPLWTGLTDIKPLPKSENTFAEKHKLTDKFVVQYSGNIGHTHDIQPMVEAAKLLKDYKDIHFLIIGRGTKLNYIKTLLKEYDLPNCTILPFQPDEVIRYSLAVADIGTVVIDEQAAQMSVPSKIYNIMAVGSALLCIAPVKSELNKMVQEYNNGETYMKSDIEGIKNYILKLYNDPSLTAKYKEQSKLASKNYTKKNAVTIFETHSDKK